MTKVFPNRPLSGKNSEVYINSSDGLPIVSETMTIQASFNYRGETYANRIYKLAAGKTLINMRPALQPSVIIDGIIEGLEISPTGVAGEIAISAGVIEAAGDLETVTAVGNLALSVAAANKCWNAIVVNVATQVLSVVKGTDGATLLDTYGSSAGQRPIIADNVLLIGWVEVGTAPYTALSTDINYLDREIGGIQSEVLANLGGVLLPQALPDIHTSGRRPVKFSGYYLDTVMSKIGTAKNFSLTPNTQEVSDETFDISFTETSIGSWGFNFAQLTGNKSTIDAALLRQGFCALKFVFPNGFGYQFAATIAPSINSDPGSAIEIPSTGSVIGWPAEIE